MRDAEGKKGNGLNHGFFFFFENYNGYMYFPPLFEPRIVLEMGIFLIFSCRFLGGGRGKGGREGRGSPSKTFPLPPVSHFGKNPCISRMDREWISIRSGVRGMDGFGLIVAFLNGGKSPFDLPSPSPLF